MRRLPRRAVAPTGSGSPRRSLAVLAASGMTPGASLRSRPGGPAPPSSTGGVPASLPLHATRGRRAAKTCRTRSRLFEAILAELLPERGAVDAEDGGGARLLAAAGVEHA